MDPDVTTKRPFDPTTGEMPTTEELLKIIDTFGGMSEEAKEESRRGILEFAETRGQLYQQSANAEKITGTNKLPAPTQMYVFLFLGAFGIILCIFAFFGYKLYKSLTDREKRKEEKKKQKLQKKRK